jgi:DNA-binding beta-propeller fold protein YncE
MSADSPLPHFRLSRFARIAVTTLALVAAAAFAHDDDDDDDHHDPRPFTLSLERIGGYDGGALGASEINAYDAQSKRLFVSNGANRTVDVLDLTHPSLPRLVATLDISDLGAGVNSVAVHRGLVALAVEAAPKTSPGTVAFYRADDLSRLAVVTVGAQPDMLVFTKDGQRVVVANEGEPNSYGLPDSVDPEGSVSIIDVNRRGQRIDPVVRTADFKAFNGRIDELRAQGVRIYGPGATVAQDLEPEYIALDPRGKLAHVVLQENNAVATVDLDRAQVTAIRALGLKDHSRAGAGLDPSDEDGGTDTNSGTPAVKIGTWPVFGLYLPDGMAAYSARGETFLVTANEGDARADWPGFNEEVRIRAHCPNGLDPAVFGADAARLLFDSNLGRLRVTSAPNGDDSGKNAAGQCTKLWSYGARSFSIWRASDLKRVYDSGDDFEQRTTALPNAKFNSGHDNDTLDSRSPAKGPEPEGITLGRLGGRTFAFIGLERIGGVMVYDITDPYAPAFETYLNPRDGLTGDRGPEGLTFIPARRSPNGKPLLVVSHEVSGTTAVLQINIARGAKRAH